MRVFEPGYNLELTSTHQQWRDFFKGSIFTDIRIFSQSRIAMALDRLATPGLDERESDRLRGVILAYREFINLDELLMLSSEDKNEEEQHNA